MNFPKKFTLFDILLVSAISAAIVLGIGGTLISATNPSSLPFVLFPRYAASLAAAINSTTSTSSPALSREPVILDLSRPPQTLSGEVKIKTTLKEALNVEFFLKNTSQAGEPFYLGIADPIEGYHPGAVLLGEPDAFTVWGYEFDTTTIQNGEYILYAQVYNIQGKFYKDGFTQIKINNQSQSNSQSQQDNYTINIDNNNDQDDDQSQQTTQATSQAVSEPSIQIEFSKDAENLKDEVTVEASTVNAQSVKFFLILPQTNDKVFVGSPELIASQTTNNGDNLSEWRFRWNTWPLANKEYLFLAVMENTFGEFESDLIEVKIENDLTPAIKLEFSKNPENLKGKVNIRIKAKRAREVTLFIRPAAGLNRIRLGDASPVNGFDDTWQLFWNTRAVSNGEYTIFAKIKNMHGDYLDGFTDIAIRNFIPTVTQPEPEVIVPDKEVVEEIIDEVEQTTEAIVEEAIPEEEKIKEAQEIISDKSSSKKHIERLARETRERLENIREKEEERDGEKSLTKEIRKNTSAALKEEIKKYEKELVDEIEQQTETETTAIALREKLQHKVAERQKILVDKIAKKVLHEQIFGDKAAELVLDVDNDGLSLLDEERMGTDPFSSDTDGDGFEDAFEVKNGFDPLSPTEDKISYGDPKKEGQVRKEVYRVVDVALETEEAKERLVVSGTAYPLSYVVVYIYSDPLVVTVKTDEFGQWTYTLEQDVDEGEHEVYVAVTDNTGQVLEKSEPLRFVKVAQAVSIVDAETTFAAPGKTQSAFELDPLRKFIIIAFLIVILATITAIIIVSLQGRKQKSKSNKDKSA